MRQIKFIPRLKMYGDPEFDLVDPLNRSDQYIRDIVNEYLPEHYSVDDFMDLRRVLMAEYGFEPPVPTPYHLQVG